MNRNIHIIIAESSTIVFDGLSAIFFRSVLKPYVSRAGTLDDIQQLDLKRKCDIVLINPSFIQNNVKAYHTLKNQFENTKWIGLVYAYYEQQILSLFDATITISDSLETIIGIVSKIINTTDSNALEQIQDNLTERENDVLKLLVSGMANKEIADKLNISINTVITHRKNISQKTGIKSVSGLTIYAVVKKIITLENFSE